MVQTTTLVQQLPDCRDKALAGGKAVNLGVLLRAGFVVPDGFCVTTDAYRYWAHTQSSDIPSDLVDQILRAYRAMGSPAVAVRSSATAEDMSEASMAGQYDTFLDIHNEDQLLSRIRCCWASLDSPRTRAYLKEHGIQLSQVAMAVVVQRLVPSDVAGVLFTANPQTGSKNEMLVESSWGLGEAVVSGLVQPDVLQIDRQTGRVVKATIADKQILIPPGSHDEQPVPAEKRRIPSLKGPDVLNLWKLGIQAASHFGAPQDIEWAIHDGKLYLLQSRPITTLAEAEAYEHLLTSTRAQLRELIDKNRGPWVVHNISETLPHPTPLTWSVIKRFMSGDGGFGKMYRQAGFEPSPLVCREGFLTRIAGKIYMDASLGPEMFFEGFPFKYDIEQLRKNPDAAQNPPTIPVGGLTTRMKMARKAAAASQVVHQLALTFDQELTTTLIPRFQSWVQQEKSRDLSALSTDQLIELWHDREKSVMDDFAPASLLPSLISGAALAELRSFLEECFWNEDPDQLATQLSSAHQADLTVQSNIALFNVAQQLPSNFEPGTENSELSSWLSTHGHRAPEEFDLSTPRWHERPEDLLTMARRLRSGANPAKLHQQHLDHCREKLDALKQLLSPADQKTLDDKIALARRYMPFRENAKYYLMLGYQLLRDVALEMGRRIDIGHDVFLLSQEELFDALHIGFAPTHLIAQRKIERRAEKRIPLPHVIDAQTIETLGAPPQWAMGNGQSAMEAFPISPGQATGPARIVRDPSQAPDLGEKYILVCPSTDPSWTPLFTNAAGLILECGGTLSHGAVVAREMSIPAVVLRNACTLLSDGDPITIDGRNGSVSSPSPLEGEGRTVTPSPGTPGEGRGKGLTPSPARANNLASPHTASRVGEGRGEDQVFNYQSPSTTTTNSELSTKNSPHDTKLDRPQIPPPPGRRERSAARLRNLFLAAWGLYLLLVFILPEQLLYQPSLKVLDFFLWPLVRAVGKVWTVAIIAAALGALTMILQKLLTDNHRLLVAKARATALNRQAARLPADSPRAQRLRALAAPVQMRILGASLLPIALLLGPMVMTFFWLPERVEPSTWNLPPGTAVTVMATVRTEMLNNQGRQSISAVTLDVPAQLSLDSTTPASPAVPPIREVLESHRAKLTKPSDFSSLPWEVREQVQEYLHEKLASLNAYLKEPTPPHTYVWTVRSPESVSDRWPLTLKVNVAKQVVPHTQTIHLVLGDRFPPSPGEIQGRPDSPVVNLKIIYPPSETKRQFFAPVAHKDLGWLTVYLLAYLPAMFALRFALKVA